MKPEVLVYKPTRLHPRILKKINDKIGNGEYANLNEAINKSLAKQLKVELPKQITLKDLTNGDTFKFATSSAYKLYKVKDNCKLSENKRLRQRKRKCEEVETGKIIHPDCNREVIKIE